MADPQNMPVNTPELNAFFNNEVVRRKVLILINSMNNWNRCHYLGLNPNESEEWTERILDDAANLKDEYVTHGFDEMIYLDCGNDNNNSNSNANSNDELNLGNNAGPLPNAGTRFLAAGAENTIMGDEIEDGDLMVNFQDEFGHSRYYKKSTYNSLQAGPDGQKRNPYTQQPIVNARTYTAVLGPPVEGGKRRKIGSVHFTAKRRKSRRLRRTRK